MDIATVLSSLIAGAVGGNIIGALFKKFSLGTIGNTLAGVVGGGLAGYAILNMMSANDMAATFAGLIASSAVGGAVVTFIAGVIKNSMNLRARDVSSNLNNTTSSLRENPQTINFRKNQPSKSRDYPDGPPL